VRLAGEQHLTRHPPTSPFEAAVLEQSDAAYNLARWLVGNDADAQDVVQDACMKALRAAASYRGGDFRAWFLTIVRTTSYSHLRQRRSRSITGGEDGAALASGVMADCRQYDPHAIAARAADASRLRAAIDRLSPDLREALVLREMEGMSYKQIGTVAGVPIGTVMSRLARARAQLHMLLMAEAGEEAWR
jgi:RNA polymerase sigma-70 factor (ECF subfamily)